ncbi:MAG TPA: cytosine deaminase, partial [Gammaproteobacteria bacterium]|nr:cytosine deaminase [Gammaproteobacteria bacterium]
PDYGLTPGCNADMVVLQAGDPVEALRLKANRLFVIRRGRIIAESAPHEARVHMMGVDSTVNFAHGEFNGR